MSRNQALPFLSSPSPAYQCGGKAENLFVLQSLGFRVPPFVVIPWDHLSGADDAQLNEISAAILQHFKALPAGEHRYAVRSSAVAEDGKQHSFAGQFETHLNVFPEKLTEKIADVRASAQNERVRAYRKEQGLESDAAIAVIVQQMLLPEVSGVAFGAHPVSGNLQEKVLSAVYGLGEGLVGGLLDADTFTVDAKGNIISQLARKDQKMMPDPSGLGGTTLTEVPENLQTAPCLGEAQIREIASALDQLNQHYHHPQDVEFALAGGQLYLLQTRPITTIGTAQPALEGRVSEFVWDNSNIVESYPGLTSPLTFSFIIKMYEGAYRQMMGMMGVSPREIEQNREVLANMLGLIEGRVYYNLLHWYKALAVLPGFGLNAAFMERMMGVKERFELKDLPQRGRWTERLRVLNLVRTMLGNLWALPKMRRDFEAGFEAVMQEYGVLDFTKKTAEELAALYLRYEQTVLKKWNAPLVNDFFTMIYFGVLQKLTVKYRLDEGGTLHNDLLCGARDIVSTEPIHRCLQLAADIQKEPATKQLFVEKTAEVLAETYRQGQFPAPIQAQIETYLERWGNRCVGELKLETITYRQQPALFMHVIQSYVRQGIQNQKSRIDLDMREKAEQVVREKLRGQPLRRLIFNHVLKNTRVLVSGRENLRYARTRGYGTVREIFCALGMRFQERGILGDARDIFFLTQAEIFDHIKGTSVNGNLRDLVALRKNQYAQWEKSPPPAERFATSGIVYAGNDFRLDRNPKADISAADTLRGLGCCPGKVRAQVRVVRHPSEVSDLNGDILVTSNTDPGWVTLFPTAGAILVEKGSLLSHSAIVSREMGKPCIVGISGLLQRLQTGDWVEMDGSTGEVKILSAA
ncbi:MAG: PEP/pyruvate-binding domain-containing protein [Saprospiraceae bacterium]